LQYTVVPMLAISIHGFLVARRQGMDAGHGVSFTERPPHGGSQRSKVGVGGSNSFARSSLKMPLDRSCRWVRVLDEAIGDPGAVGQHVEIEHSPVGMGDFL
jgi:hypothetical protein